MTIADVLVEAQVIDKASGGTCVILGASVSLDRPPEYSASRRLSVPPNERKRCEHAIEAAVNSEILATKQQLTISSPIPPVAFIAETQADVRLLAEMVSVDLGDTSKNVEWFDHTLDRDVSLSALTDRFDGVSLLASALGHDRPTGKGHEMLRLLERAFARSSSHLIAPLSQFLESGDLEFSRSEVEKWIDDVRHPLTHADRSDFFAGDTDVAPFIPRLELAAFDVLCNKEEWRSPATERRALWHPRKWTSPEGKVRSLSEPGRGGQLIQIFDPFRAFPLNLEGMMPVAAGMWYRYVDP